MNALASIGKLFRRKIPAAMKPAKTHDYTDRYWGHNYMVVQCLDNGNKLKTVGWGYDIEVGDYLIIQNMSGTTRYRVDNIQYKSNPSDMWSADLTFAPRTQEDAT